MTKIFDTELFQLKREWTRLNEAPRERLVAELKELKEKCANCSKLQMTDPKNYDAFYTSIRKVNCSVIMRFLKAVKNYSSECYDFLTDGHDLLNFNNYMAMSGKGAVERSTQIIAVTDFLAYFSYVLLKAHDEKDFEKKDSILIGLIGL